MVNSRYLYILLSMFVLFMLSNCERQEIDHTKMVVEGWIDVGRHPIVMLHTSYSLDASSDPDDTKLIDVLEEHMVLFGKVVLFDGEDSVILTGRVDTNYLPPYIYTTTKMRGEIGKTYTLHAMYKDFSVRSRTHIPQKVSFDSIRVFLQNGRMNIIGYANNLEIGEAYAMFVCKENGRQYILCPLGVFLANAKQMNILVRNPLDWDNDPQTTSFSFPIDTTGIRIKFAHIDAEEYEVLNSINTQSLTQGMFFLETHSNIISNIQGGNGYWCGMGSSEYVVNLNKDTLYVFY